MSRHNTIQINGPEVFLAVGRDWYHFNTMEKPLGNGAMGTVYLGRNCNNHHELVAIKHVNPAYASIPSIRERGRLEASLTFSHRNLIEMIGCCEDGTPTGPMFLVSRFVPGTTIDKYINKTFKNHKDRVTKIIKCILPVLDALDYIHSRGIIHLDIKPSNIMVENGSNVRLMDLGIAFTHDSPAINTSGLLGTPGYAAPEQYIEKGKPAPQFGPTTDIFQLAASIYQLIGGALPYSNSQYLKKLPGVSKKLMNVIETALEPDQEDRYQTARAFADALRSVMDNKQTFWEKIFK